MAFIIIQTHLAMSMENINNYSWREETTNAFQFYSYWEGSGILTCHIIQLKLTGTLSRLLAHLAFMVLGPAVILVWL